MTLANHTDDPRLVEPKSAASRQASSERQDEVHRRAAELASSHGFDHLAIERFDAATQNPKTIRARRKETVLPDPDPVKRAQTFLEDIKALFGYVGAESPEFIQNSSLQRTSGRAEVVHLQQTYQGIPVVQALQTICFSPNGIVTSTGSCPTIVRERPGAASVPVEQAIRSAAIHLTSAGNLSEGDVNSQRFLAAFELAFPLKMSRAAASAGDYMVLVAPPFVGEIFARRVWFPRQEGMEPAWEMSLTMPSAQGAYRLVVDAGDGAIISCKSLAFGASPIANVYTVDGPSPGTPTRSFTTMPLEYSAGNSDYGLPFLPELVSQSTPFPYAWVEAASTKGNSATATMQPTLTTPAPAPLSATVTTPGAVSFDPQDALGADQQVLNIFYYCCFMHDYFYILGLREDSGALQNVNFIPGGIPNDAVTAQVSLDMVDGGAVTTVGLTDGSQVTITAGPVNGVPTALDPFFMPHEYTHAVTSRLVGGGAAVPNMARGGQVASMFEGWGDYFACTVNGGQTTFSPWIFPVAGQPAGSIPGRSHPYDDTYPDSYGSSLTLLVSEDAAHRYGEIWCAALMKMNRELVALGLDQAFGAQLVFDGLKRLGVNPNFLEGRDALIQENDDRLTDLLGLSPADADVGYANHAKSVLAIWAAFSHFGMGVAASSKNTDDWDFTDIKTDNSGPAAPFISDVSPFLTSVNGGNVVTILGSGFTAGSFAVLDAVVVFDSVAVRPQAGATDVQMQVEVPPHQAGEISLLVRTPFGDSNPVKFEYLARPVVTTLTPNSGPYDGLTPVSIRGTGFTFASHIRFGQKDASLPTDLSTLSDTHVTVTAPFVFGPFDKNVTEDHVTVETPGGISATTNADIFRYGPIPSISNVVPAIGQAGTEVTIIGEGFMTPAPTPGKKSPFFPLTVSFGASSVIPLSLDYGPSGLQAKVIAPPGTGTVAVSMQTAFGGSQENGSFRYVGQPVLTSVKPNAGPISGGTSVTIHGSDFVGKPIVIISKPFPAWMGIFVTFGGIAAKSFVLVSDGTITAVNPPGVGSVHVTVSTPFGTSLPGNNDLFSYLPRPAVTSLSMIEGPVQGGTPVTINGSGFNQVSAVNFGPFAAAFAVVSATKINAVSPSSGGASGAVEVTVTTPGGVSSTGPTNNDFFNYNAPVSVLPPDLFALQPASGPAGTIVSILGLGLETATKITFGGVEASFDLGDEDTPLATAPPGMGTVEVVVFTPNGASVVSNGGDNHFTYE